MPAGEGEKSVLRFGVFELNLRTAELRRSGALVKLQPQPFKVLALLAQRPGDLVTREEIQQAVWGEETFVDFERGLNFCIKQIRSALGDDAETPRYVETLPRRGYRFLVPVEGLGEASPPAVLPPAPPREQPFEPSPVPSQAAVRRVPTWLAVVGLVAIVALVAYVTRQVLWPRPRPGKIMLVVLPFDNLSHDPDQEYFSDGLTEEMITQLGRLDPARLGVIARTSAMKYKGSDKSAARIGRELNVDYILEGSVRREGERVAISAQLIQVSDQTHLWAETYGRELAGVLDLQREVGQRIVNSLALELLPAQQAALARSTPVNPEAYQAYLKGRFYWNRRALQESVKSFEEATAKDPNFALAYAGLADAHGLLGSTPYDLLPPHQAKPKALAAARKALSLDDTLAEAHAALARDKLFYEWDWPGAEREFQRAIALNPSYSVARQWYAEYLWLTGRWDEALNQIERALERDPNSLIVTHFALGRHYYLRRQYPEAIKVFQEWTRMDPSFFLGHFDLGLAYVHAGRHAEAVAEFQEAVRLSEGSPLCLAGLGYAYARMERPREARRVLYQLEQLSRQRYVPALYVAGIYAGLGERDRAFEWLEKAYADRADYLMFLRLEPPFDSLRDDPRYRDLLRRMNFPTD